MLGNFKWGTKGELSVFLLETDPVPPVLWRDDLRIVPLGTKGVMSLPKLATENGVFLTGTKY